jgi:putative tricarboxylic transport membrane protein
MKESNMVRADFLTSIGIVSFGAFALYESWNMPRFEEQNVNPYTAPGLVPGMLGIMFMFLGTIMFVRSLRRGGYRLGLTRAGAARYLALPGTRRYGVTLGLCLLYSLVFIGRLPYWLGTGLFVLLFIVVFELNPEQPAAPRWRRLLTALVEAALVAAGVTYVFQELFLVTLP